MGRLRIREGKAILPGGGGEIRLAPRLHSLPLKGYRAEERRLVSFLRERFRVKREKRSEQAAIFRAVDQVPGATPPPSTWSWTLG